MTFQIGEEMEQLAAQKQEEEAKLEAERMGEAEKDSRNAAPNNIGAKEGEQWQDSTALQGQIKQRNTAEEAVRNGANGIGEGSASVQDVQNAKGFEQMQKTLGTTGANNEPGNETERPSLGATAGGIAAGAASLTRGKPSGGNTNDITGDGKTPGKSTFTDAVGKELVSAQETLGSFSSPNTPMTDAAKARKQDGPSMDYFRNMSEGKRDPVA